MTTANSGALWAQQAANMQSAAYCDPVREHIKRMSDVNKYLTDELKQVRREMRKLRDFITYMEIEHPGSTERFQLWHAARRRVLDAIGETSETST